MCLVIVFVIMLYNAFSMVTGSLFLYGDALRWCRWEAVSLSSGGVRARVHPVVQPTATPEEPRRSGRAGQEPSLPLHHLWQGLCHRVQPAHSHYQGTSCQSNQLIHHCQINRIQFITMKSKYVIINQLSSSSQWKNRSLFQPSKSLSELINQTKLLVLNYLLWPFCIPLSVCSV